MRAARLLLAAPAATALVLTGISPAWAGDDGNGHHNGDDAWAKVISIGDEAELEDDGDELEVTFRYKCEDNGEDVTADVKAENDSRYEKKDVELDCDGDRHRKTVDLEKKGDDEAKDGDKLDVTVTINANGDELDEKTEEVEVVDDDDDDDDKDHHDHHHDSKVA